MKIRFMSYGIVFFACYAPFVYSIPIDPEFPPEPSIPLSIPIYYQFQTSWDGIGWANEQKTATRSGLDYLSTFFVDDPVFQENGSALTYCSTAKNRLVIYT